MDYSRRIGVLLCAAALLVGSATRGHAASAEARGTAARSITTDQLRQYVDALADDTFEGREAGTRGGRAAGGYIIGRIKKLGLQGGGDRGSFYQTFGRYRNILAMVEGRDVELKSQFIVVGAHYDHVGYGTNRNSYGPIGRIHNGADDNASGVAGLLEVMDAVCSLPEPPKRSILFAFWDGEEKGLLGSRHWVNHPTVALSRVPIAINIDMIGRMRNSRVEVFGTRTSPGLRRLVSRQNDAYGLLLDFTWEIRPDSDHQSFFARNVPFVMLHTGTHEDYHRPSDDAEKVNTDGMTQVSQLLFNIVDELAEMPAVGRFRAASRGESPRVQRSRERALAPPPGRLGVRWNESIADESGRIVVTAVTPGGAAGEAGVKPGDRFLTFAGRAVDGADPFRLGVLAAENPVTATLERAGSDEPVEVTFRLRGKPARLGISWRSDDAEPGAVIVNRVVPGSAANLAGIRVGHRVYRINGREFADGEQFRQLAVGATGPVTLEVEAAGRVHTVELPALEEAEASESPEVALP